MALINQLAEQSDSTELGSKPPAALADRQRITRGEASRRVPEAAHLGGRPALTGQLLPPRLIVTAAAQRAGDIGSGQVRVIRNFLNRLPSDVDLETREVAETHLAKLAIQFRTDVPWYWCKVSLDVPR